jgi:two-component system OmpR family response regulator
MKMSLNMQNEMSTSVGRKILLIEDDQVVSEEIVESFTTKGHRVTSTSSGMQGFALARTGEFELMIIDRGLPELDGLSIIKSLRAEKVTTPAIFLSAMGEVGNRVDGLEAGGDDYLPKPFHMFELAARAEALLRRAAPSQETQLRLGDIELDLLHRQARRGEREIDLLPREFKLLEYLMRHAGQTVTRAMLLEEVWNYKFAVETNLVDVHMSKLRHKIDGPGEEKRLLSIRGVGFMLQVA